jgi:hypothetical protein
MYTYEKQRDAWDEAGDMSNGIAGEWLKHARGVWTLDEEELDTNEFRMCVIMPTATVGEVKWFESKIVERNIGRLEDGHVPPIKPKEGWNNYVSFQAVRADEGHLGDLVTYTSTSWGGRHASRIS